MFASWLLVVALLAGAAAALDPEPLMCYQCQNNCEKEACSTDKPFCATRATSPNFTSTLTCAAATGTAERPCSLTYYEKQTYEITCICIDDLCNGPFSREMLDQLINFTNSNSLKNETGNMDLFWRLPYFANTTNDTLYRTITISSKVEVAPPEVNDLDVEGEINETATVIVSVQTTARTSSLAPSIPPRRTEGLPRAQELKAAATPPSDDDEDESEGSGSDDDPPRAEAAPAAPSSRLPAAAPATVTPPLLSVLFCLLTVYI